MFGSKPQFQLENKMLKLEEFLKSNKNKYKNIKNIKERLDIIAECESLKAERV